MTLLHGTRLGSYEVIAPLGSGGMGEVYCARDTRLGREVAIKVLPAERLADAGRRGRFEREARAVAALNHPHIVTIHEIDSAEGIDFIVMELVQGDTLAQRLRRGPLPTGEALRVAIPLADALAAAHAAGVVHRDLKPANVMLGRDGVVKVLDFGLAKLAHDDAAGSDVRTATVDVEPLSRPGTVAGTAGYMSPEQASGGDVDARSDVFSFGVLLYEMVTGRRAFPGDSSTEAIAAVLKDQPKPPGELVPDLPKELERIILRCLRKEPSRRFQHMADVKVELQEVKEESDSQASAPAGAASARRRSWRRWMAPVAAVVVVAGAAALALWRVRPSELPAPRLVKLSWVGRDAEGSFSPDGNQIAFVSRGAKEIQPHIWLKIVGEVEARRLTTDPAAGDGSPAWSPDGKQIAFLRHTSGLFSGMPSGSIYLVSPLGGAERRLLDFPARGLLSWSPDGRWLATGRARAKGETTPESGGIHLIPAGGGEPRALTFPKPPTQDSFPAFSPDSRALAYASCGGPEPLPACDVYVLSLDSALRPQGAARPLTRQGLWIAGVAWTRDGHSIVYGANGLWRVRADGGAPPERVELAGPGAFSPSTARSQDRLAFVRYRWNPDIYRLQLGGSPTPLIESTSIDLDPQYSPDGRRIAFLSGRADDREDVWLADADGSNPTRLTRGPGRTQGSPRWSPDGRTIAFDSQAEDGQWDVWAIGVDGAGQRQLTRDPADENVPSWSRDGRFVYFGSNRTGRSEIWRVASAGGAGEQVTHQGGCIPFESLDGRTLYYMRKCANDALLARPTQGGEERTIVRCVDENHYAVGPHGVFHVDCKTPEAPTATQHVVRYWDAATGQDRPVGTFDATLKGGLSVAPDGRTIVYGRSTEEFDLVMIENFR